MKNIKSWLYVGGIIVLVVAALVAVQISATPKAAVSRFNLNAPGAGLSAQPAAQNIDSPVGPQVIYSIKNDVSAPLSSIAPIAPQPGEADADLNQLNPLGNRKLTNNAAAAESDGALQTAPVGNAIPAPIVSFDGLGNLNGVLPPDSDGAVGPNHYMEWINLSFAIYNKSGTLIYGPANGNTLFSGMGAPCETTNNGDPVVLYDHLANRWLASQFSFPNGPYTGPYYQCIAVSQTNDPTGSWNRYAFQVSTNKLNDYPKFGIWKDGYYMSFNQFTGGTTWGGQGVAVFDRAAMIAGTPATMIKYDLYGVDPNLGGMLPSSLDGPAPADGTPNTFLEMDDNTGSGGVYPDQLQVWNFHTDWATPTNSTFTHATDLPVAAFSWPQCYYNGSRYCVPQPGTTRKLDAIPDRLMFRAQYRFWGDHASIVTNHTVSAGTTTGVRWYELRNSGSGWSVYQQSTFAPSDTTNRWMASAAMDGKGNIAVGYSGSSSTLYPSVYYTARLVTDALNTMTQGEGTIVTGAGSQTHSAARWGDYSSLTVDPTDDCTFWYISEYLQVTGSAPWQTRIGSFKLSNCTATGTTGTLSGTVTDASNSQPISGATVTVAGLSAQTNGNGFYTVADVPVGSYTVTAAKAGYRTGTANNVGVTNGNTTTQDFALMSASCTNKCLLVVSITMSKTALGVNAQVTVKDENGVAVPSARVYVRWNLPTRTQYMNKLTNSTGVAAFSGIGGTGTYTITVTNITKFTYTFDAADSTLVTKSFIK